MNDQIIQDYYKKIQSYIFYKEKNKEIVEDLTQEVCLALISRTHEPTRGDIWPWIIGIIHTTIYNYKRGPAYNLVFKSSNGIAKRSYHKLRKTILAEIENGTLTPASILRIAEELDIAVATITKAFYALVANNGSDEDPSQLDFLESGDLPPHTKIESLDTLSKIVVAIEKLPRIQSEILLDKYIYETNNYRLKFSPFIYNKMLREAKTKLKNILVSNGILE